MTDKSAFSKRDLKIINECIAGRSSKHINKTAMAEKFLSKARKSGIDFRKCAVAHDAFQLIERVEVSYALFNRKFKEIYND